MLVAGMGLVGKDLGLLDEDRPPFGFVVRGHAAPAS
jgi:hypothetical protein